MPRRWAPDTRALIYDLLVMHYGPDCRSCGRFPPAEEPRGHDIHHVDGNRNHSVAGNLLLLCPPCNRPRGIYSDQGNLSTMPAQPQEKEIPTSDRYVCDPIPLPNPSHTVKELVGYNAGSKEMQASDHFEHRARVWILGQVKAHGFILKREAIAGAAEYVGCSTAAVDRNYLAKLTSPIGPLQEHVDQVTRATIIVPSTCQLTDPGSTSQEALQLTEEQLPIQMQGDPHRNGGSAPDPKRQPSWVEKALTDPELTKTYRQTRRRRKGRHPLA